MAPGGTHPASLRRAPLSVEGPNLTRVGHDRTNGIREVKAVDAYTVERARHRQYGDEVNDRPPLRACLGAVVRRRRRAAGYSQEAFADLVGVHRTFMSTVERGGSNVSLETLARIASALGARAGELLLEAEDLWERAPDAAAPPSGQHSAADTRGADSTPTDTATRRSGTPEPPAQASAT
jgi:transcriptional regulator with XRE-family HTH domain